MSSYVIGKREYVKAAGLISGIAAANRQKEFWVYDYENYRNMTEKDYYNKMVECYTMNALSVQEQYGDKSPETDSNDYMKDFNEAKQKGTQAAIYGNVKDVMIQLNDFFTSAIYQTENMSYMWKMRIFFNTVIAEMVEFAFPHEVNSWGSLDI